MESSRIEEFLELKRKFKTMHRINRGLIHCKKWENKIIDIIRLLGYILPSMLTKKQTFCPRKLS